MYPGAYRSQTTPFRVFKYFEKEKTRKIQYVEFHSRSFVRAKRTERQRCSTSPANSVTLNPSRGHDLNTIKQSKFIGFSMTWKHETLTTLINLKLKKFTIYSYFIFHEISVLYAFLSLHVLSKRTVYHRYTLYNISFNFELGREGYLGISFHNLNWTREMRFFHFMYSMTMSISILNGIEG